MHVCLDSGGPLLRRPPSRSSSNNKFCLLSEARRKLQRTVFQSQCSLSRVLDQNGRFIWSPVRFVGTRLRERRTRTCTVPFFVCAAREDPTKAPSCLFHSRADVQNKPCFEIRDTGLRQSDERGVDYFSKRGVRALSCATFIPRRRFSGTSRQSEGAHYIHSPRTVRPPPVRTETRHSHAPPKHSSATSATE